MAGPYYTKLQSYDGRIINIYHAGGDAIGKNLNVESNGGVTSTSPITFTIRPGEPFQLQDIRTTVVDGTPTHQIEFVKDDDPQGKYLALDTSYANTNQARAIPKLTLTAGVYKVLVRVACPA